MATPHVTGAIALYTARYPGARAADIKSALLASTKLTSSLSSTVTKGRLDVVAFLNTAPPGWEDPDETSAPAMPEGLSATAISSTQIRLTWNDTANETGYVLTRSPGVNGSTTVNLLANITSYTDSGLSPLTTYTYSIQACNSVGGCSLAATVKCTTLSPPPQATAAFVREDNLTCGSWLNRHGLKGYEIINYRSLPTGVTVAPAGQSIHTWATSTSDIDALQKPDGSSRFAVCWYSFTSFGLQVNLPAGETHRVSVYAVDYDTETRLQSIEVIDPNYDKVLDTRNLSSFGIGRYVTWDITGNVIIKFTYTGSTPQNAVVSGVFFDAPGYLPPLPSPPVAPSGLTAAAVSRDQINLSWTDNSTDESGFKIERSTSATTGFAQIATVGAGATTYANTGLSRNTTYYYRVCAYNGDGDSVYSNTASARTPSR